MLATRWEPWNELNRLSREMDRLFTRGVPSGTSAITFPALNVWEDDGTVYVEAELPGFETEQLEIDVDANQLTLKGERSAPEMEGGTWHRQERGFGSFHRMMELPADIDAEQVSADFQCGILRITLPKSETAKPRRIEVQSS
ncbi:heat shock protein, HSP20 family [Rhodopirellula islandica]|uniref:Heat shock protein, HSP20 family n=1 Tax=Rhodopirellula islandica TaxID=595434 RepID=A0A0J1B7C2_RHOIS|nr:Hsp20/alpha crystallin family protein [Rhodopirellula islandica]KLU02473.1 heat shock protein, HSP20 family [Rhodopirellula islandica]